MALRTPDERKDIYGDTWSPERKAKFISHAKVNVQNKKKATDQLQCGIITNNKSITKKNIK